MNEARMYEDNYRGIFREQEEFLACLSRISESSYWKRRKAKNLRIVAIKEGSQIAEEMKEKYSKDGLDEGIISDTIVNTGLLLKDKDKYYPVRGCAIKSILDRAGIAGNGLRKVEKNVYARILNDLLKVAKGEALIRVSEGKVSAVLSGDCNDYSILDVEELFLHTVDYLNNNFKGCNYLGGFYEHDMVSGMWELSGEDKLLEAYKKILALNGKTPEEMKPVIRITTSDTGAGAANIYPMLVCGADNMTINIGVPLRLEHRNGNNINDFDNQLKQIYAKYERATVNLINLLGITILNPVNCMKGVMEKLKIPKRYQAEAIDLFKGNGCQFTAVGNNLPESDSVEVELHGSWIKNSYGTQYQVTNFEEILPQTEEGILGYLSSGMIKGIGPKTAKMIVAKYGTRTFEILDKYPDSLLSIKGITERKLETIMLSYHGSHAMRDLAAYLTPFNVTPKKIQKIYEKFGETAIDTVKTEPFRLCEINGFGFLTVDAIAKANQCKLNDPMRIEGCINYCTELDMQEGHLFHDKQLFQKRVYEQLNHGYNSEVVTEMEVYQVLYKMVRERDFYYEDGALYPAKLYGYECDASRVLVDLLLEKSEPVSNIDELIEEAQSVLGIQLSKKQIEGVKKAFTYLVSIITGGPGTGKTTVQHVLLYIYEKLGGKNVLLTAPTGRASRRMAESTGRTDAVTMHSSMGLNNDEECESTGEMFEADFIIGDEFTMSDMRLSKEFFCHIKKGTRVVIVGDVNQLPSVGPGNVFRELVLCGIIPVTKLDMVFRQAENSRIAMNAYKMQDNNAMLDYGEDFTFIAAANDKEAAEIIAEIYEAKVKQHGLNMVALDV